MAIAFIIKPTKLKVLENLNTQYSIISANILNSEVTKNNLVLLNEVEYKQVLYWYPHTIGEVIFSTNFD